jgi:F-type H+-transporting ATPase subunit delta
MAQPGDQGSQAALAEAARQPTVMDVGAERVARVYAEALLRAAEPQGQIDALLDEMDSLIQDVYRTEPQLELFFASDAVGRDRKAAVIHTVFDNRATPLFVNSLLVLNDHQRLPLLRAIVAEYRELRDRRANRVHVLVRSAVPLPPDQLEHLKQHLRTTFRMEPILDTQIDPELLGGVVVRVGDWLFDRSVRAELKDIRDQIIARSSYEIQSRRDRFSSANGD